MKFILHSVFLGVILLIILFSACEKEPDSSEIYDEEIGCGLDLDLDIYFDTLWITEHPNPAIYKFFDDYFAVYLKSSHSIELYSSNTGQLINTYYIELEYYEFHPSGMAIIGDTLFYSDWDYIIHRIDIHTGEELQSDEVLTHSTFLYEKDYFYYIYYGQLIQSDYELSNQDTLDYFEGLDDYDLRIYLKYFQYPAPLNDEFLIIVSTGSTAKYNNEYLFNFYTYDLNKQQIKKQYLTDDRGQIEQFKVEDFMINLSTRSLRFAYDLRSHNYFDYKTNHEFIPQNDICTLSEASGYAEKRQALVFFRNGQYLQACEFGSREMIWSCDGYTSKNFRPLYLIDEKGISNKYLCFTYYGTFYMADPFTGVINAQFKVAEYEDSIKSNISYFSTFQNQNEMILVTSDQIMKIKIQKR